MAMSLKPKSIDGLFAMLLAFSPLGAKKQPESSLHFPLAEISTNN
jgi:hypothetical protein